MRFNIWLYYEHNSNAIHKWFTVQSIFWSIVSNIFVERRRKIVVRRFSWFDVNLERWRPPQKESSVRVQDIRYDFYIFIYKINKSDIPQDFDNDGLLSREDLKQLVNRLIGNEKLDENSMNKLLEKILSEADLDNDGYLSFNEFQHIILKSSTDFLR